ncbi:MAG: deoxyribonuclease IV [Deltaproteobacteria bacterium]|nr:deoxyribonuclease IV [Deltaproteobacteria bacterium]
MLLGAHVSIAGGLDLAVGRGLEIGAEALQVFTKNQVQWDSAPLDPDVVMRFKGGMLANELAPVSVHGSYLINLASADDDIRKKSRNALVDELIRGNVIGANYLILHPGSHGGDGETTGLQRIGQGLGWCLKQAGVSRPRLLLENTAGQGRGVGHRFEQIRDLIDRVPEHWDLGVCLDTCHAFAAGYDMSEEGYDAVFEEFDRVVGLERLLAFHLNDSKTERKSRVDRHERIGKGQVGMGFFRLLMRDPRFVGLPGYLEVPGGKTAFKADLKLLKRLRTSGGMY